MKNSIIVQNKYKILSLVVILILWQILSIIYSPIVIPSIDDVMIALKNIFIEQKLRAEILITIKRLSIALSISVVSGVILGIAGGCDSKIKGFIMPIVNIVQSVPPISWLVLALIWFGLDGKASIFIAAVSTVPLIIINIIEGVSNIDSKLIEMGKMYKFSRWKMIKKVVVPSIIPYFEAALKLAIGSGCKVIVMGEVLSTSNGIGGQLTNARLNIETEYIFAWTIIIVLMFYLSNKLLTYLFEKGIKGERYAYKNAEFN